MLLIVSDTLLFQLFCQNYSRPCYRPILYTPSALPVAMLHSHSEEIVVCSKRAQIFWKIKSLIFSQQKEVVLA